MGAGAGHSGGAQLQLPAPGFRQCVVVVLCVVVYAMRRHRQRQQYQLHPRAQLGWTKQQLIEHTVKQFEQLKRKFFILFIFAQQLKRTQWPDLG